MKKLILGVIATAAIATPLAFAGTASAAPAPVAKATGSVTWLYQFNDGVTPDRTGTVTFIANNKDGGTLDYTDSVGQIIHGVVTPGTVAKAGNKVTFTGVITDSNNAWYINQPFTGVVIDVSTFGRNGDQIGLYVNRADDGKLMAVTAGNLTVF